MRNTKSSYGYNRSTAVYNITHEIGHTLKFAHPNHGLPSVMYQGMRPMPTTAYNQDKYELNYKWGSK